MNQIFQFMSQVEKSAIPVLEVSKDQVVRFTNHNVRLVDTLSERMNQNPVLAIGLIAQVNILFFALIHPLVNVLDHEVATRCKTWDLKTKSSLSALAIGGCFYSFNTLLSNMIKFPLNQLVLGSITVTAIFTHFLLKKRTDMTAKKAPHSPSLLDPSKKDALEVISSQKETECEKSTKQSIDQSADVTPLKKDHTGSYVDGQALNNWADSVIEELLKEGNSFKAQKYSELEFFKALLIKSNLININNLAKFGKLDDTSKSIITNIISAAYNSPLGKFQIEQNCYDKLIEFVPLLDTSKDEDDGLYALASTGLLDEKKLELFAAHPSAFKIDTDLDSEESASDSENFSRLKEKLENIIKNMK